MSTVAVSPHDDSDFEKVSKELRENAENLVSFAKGYQGTIERLINFLAKVREANHFADGIYQTMTENRRNES